MVGFRSDKFLMEMLDTHRIISILRGRVFGKGMARNIAHGFENSGRVRQMCRGKVAERLTFCAQFDASELKKATSRSLSSYIISSLSMAVKVWANGKGSRVYDV